MSVKRFCDCCENELSDDVVGFSTERGEQVHFLYAQKAGGGNARLRLTVDDKHVPLDQCPDCLLGSIDKFREEYAGTIKENL